MSPRAAKLFVGIGNVLRHDDGVGVRAAELMSKLPLPDDVEVHDAGLCGHDTVCLMEERDRVVVVDAIDCDAEPGTIFRMNAGDVRPFSTRRGRVSASGAPSADVPGIGISLHQMHFLDALDEMAILGTAPKEVVLIAVQVEDTTVGVGLSEAVERALPDVARVAARELGVPDCSAEAKQLMDSVWR